MYLRGSRWYSDFWYRGRRYVKSLGPVNKTVAGEKDRVFRSDVASGDYQRKVDNPMFRQAMKEHLQKSKAENVDSSYRRNILSARYLNKFFGNKQVRDIESNEILMQKYISMRKKSIQKKQISGGRDISEVTYTSINRELALMRSMFNVLIKAGKARKNPVSLVTLFEEVEKDRVLSVAEVEKIFHTIEISDIRYHHLKDILVIGLNTAARMGEIMAMKRSWVDLREGIIRVPRASQKRKKKDKRVPINSVTKGVIKRLMSQETGSEYLIVNPKTGTRFTTIQNSWNGILKKAGLEGVPGVDKLRLHDIRHTAATFLAKSGKNIKFIAQYLGHSDERTSARYIHYSDEDLKDGAEILSQFSGEVPSKVTTPKLEIIKQSVSS